MDFGFPVQFHIYMISNMTMQSSNAPLPLQGSCLIQGFDLDGWQLFKVKLTLEKVSIRSGCETA